MKNVFNRLHKKGYSNRVIAEWFKISIAELKKLKGLKPIPEKVIKKGNALLRYNPDKATA